MQKNGKLIRYVIIAFGLFVTMFSYYVWQIAKTPNYEVDEKKGFALLIPKGATYETVWDSLNAHKIVKDRLSFQFLAKLKGILLNQAKVSASISPLNRFIPLSRPPSLENSKLLKSQFCTCLPFPFTEPEPFSYFILRL